MSSFLGHSLAAVTIYIGTESFQSRSSVPNCFKSLFTKRDRLIWLFWLIVIASIPDLDYIVKAWQSSNNQGLRITHSILVSLLVPGLTIAALFVARIKTKQLLLLSLQAILAGLSHLALDMCVGVTPLPLLYPTINIPFKLPFGILPSAGKIDLSNYYFYRNLKLEMGVLLPIFILVCVWCDSGAYPKGNRALKDTVTHKAYPKGNRALKDTVTHKSYLKGNLATDRFLRLTISIVLVICLGYFIRLNLALPR